MKSVSVTELKAELSKYLRIVKKGGEVQVLERGVPIARIVATVAKEGADERLDRLVEAGLIRRGTGDVSWILETPPIAAPSAKLREALAEDREDRV